VADALKLLSGGEAFQSPLVRKYAVAVLSNASDEELHILLLQLVQALRYEPAMGVGSGKGEERLTDKDDKDEQFSLGVNTTPSGEEFDLYKDEKEDKVYSLSLLSPLGRFLVERACSSTTGGNDRNKLTTIGVLDMLLLDVCKIATSINPTPM
jgi:hypothetical protein